MVIDSNVQKAIEGHKPKHRVVSELREESSLCPFISHCLLLPLPASLSHSPSQLLFLTLSLCSVCKYLISLDCFSSFHSPFALPSPPSSLPLHLSACLSIPTQLDGSFTHLPFLLFLPSPILESPTTHHIKMTHFLNFM